ncbi:MAG: F0F1 ATP synthase subunit delta [Alphaproteobacteria bacterium]|nr:F0F1 ATP synthase subunit delta [Alphaproteobacteria bacterium]
MGIDWVTFGAQIVNLFVLIWLLKRFLYHPILEVIDKRQAEINAQVKSAQDAKNQVDQEKAEWEKEKAHFDDMRQKRLNDLALEEQNLHKQLNVDIHKQEQEKRSQLQQNLDTEVKAIQDEMRSIIAHQFVAFSQKLLQELTQGTPFDTVIQTITNKINKLDKKQKLELEKNLLKQNVINITSSNQLSKKQQQELLKTFKKVCPINAKTKVMWKVDSDLILGLEIYVGNSLIEWNLKNYLDELNYNIRSATTALILSEKDE